MVLLKICILSMETAGRALSRGRLSGFAILVLTVACASAGGRKRSSLNQSNQVIEESSGAPGTQVQADGSAARVLVTPIGSQEVTRFPHLAPFRGRLLLARAGLHVVVNAHQQEWVRASHDPWTRGSTVAKVPLVEAVFHPRAGGGPVIRSIASESVGLTLDCLHSCDGGAARAMFRLNGVAEVPLEAGAAGIRSDLVISLGRSETQVAQVRVLLSDMGPSVSFEVRRPPVVNPQLRVAIEPDAGAGTLLVVPEEHIVEGGDMARVAYTQTLAGNTQSLLVPVGSSQIQVTGQGPIAPGGSTTQIQFPRFDSSFLSSAVTRLRLMPSMAVLAAGGAEHSVRGAMFFGEEAAQNGLRHALEQELGNSYDGSMVGPVRSSSDTASAQGPVDAGWIANDSGQPLLMVTAANGWQIRVPREKYSASEPPLPLVLKNSLPQGSIEGLEPLVQHVHEPLAEVTFEATSGMSPDLLAVVPIGAHREERKLLVKLLPGEGATPVARGVLAVTRWPARMRLPQGVFEAFYLARGRGVLCRVPFDVSRQRIDSGTSALSCSPGWRGAGPVVGQKQVRLAGLDGVQPAPWSPANLVVIQNRALGLEFKVAPPPSPAVTEIFRRLGDLDFDPPESFSLALMGGPRSVAYPCGAGDGLMASIRSMRVAARDTLQIFPFHSCESLAADDQALAVAETTHRSGARVALMPAQFLSMLDERKPLLDRIFPWEPLAPSSAGKEVPPTAVGRAGTFIEASALRRLDGDRVEATIKVGRASRGLRYVDTPWTPRRIVAWSGGKAAGEWMLETARSDYKVIFRVASAEAGKQTRDPVRFLVTGSMDGIVANLLQVSGEFPVATTQFLDVP